MKNPHIINPHIIKPHIKYDDHAVLLKFIAVEFYKLSGHNPLLDNYNPVTVNKHVHWMWNELGKTSSKGFIDENDLNLYKHPIYGIVLKLYPLMRGVFKTTTVEPKDDIQKYCNNGINTTTTQTTNKTSSVKPYEKETMDTSNTRDTPNPSDTPKKIEQWIVGEKWAVSDTALFHREHLTNLVLLILISDIALMKHNTSSFSPDTVKEIIKDAKNAHHHKEHSSESIELYYDTLFLRDTITRAVSGNLRKTLGMNRIRYQEKVYAGFDTEYVSQESPDFINELLCSSTALFTRSFLRIQKLKLDSINFSLTMGKDSRKLSPDLAKLIFIQLLYIRFLDDKKDNEIETLIKYLKNKVTDLYCYVEDGSYLFTFQKKFSKDKFITCFNDHRGNPKGYSLKFLVEQITIVTKELRDVYLKE